MNRLVRIALDLNENSVAAGMSYIENWTKIVLERLAAIESWEGVEAAEHGVAAEKIKELFSPLGFERLTPKVEAYFLHCVPSKSLDRPYANWFSWEDIVLICQEEEGGGVLGRAGIPPIGYNDAFLFSVSIHTGSVFMISHGSIEDYGIAVGNPKCDPLIPSSQSSYILEEPNWANISSAANQKWQGIDDVLQWHCWQLRDLEEKLERDSRN